MRNGWTHATRRDRAFLVALSVVALGVRVVYVGVVKPVVHALDWIEGSE